MTQLISESLLSQAIANQQERMRGYEVPSEALTFETVRALDYAFCRELIPHLTELRLLFPAPRWRCVDGVKIRRRGKVVTDIDFVAYDSASRTAALFQLKWQQPSAGDEKTRRNNASNLVSECNKWIAAVSEWLAEEGLPVLAQRLGIPRDELTDSSLFVLGRYGAHFSGHANADLCAAWSNWGHFERERTLHPSATVREMFDNLVEGVTEIKRTVQPESLTLPLPGLVLVVNPNRRPADMELP